MVLIAMEKRVDSENIMALIPRKKGPSNYPWEPAPLPSPGLHQPAPSSLCYILKSHLNSSSSPPAFQFQTQLPSTDAVSSLHLSNRLSLASLSSSPQHPTQTVLLMLSLLIP